MVGPLRDRVSRQRQQQGCMHSRDLTIQWQTHNMLQGVLHEVGQPRYPPSSGNPEQGPAAVSGTRNQAAAKVQ